MAKKRRIRRKAMTTQLVVRMPLDLREALEALSDEEDRPVGNMVRVLLGEALAARVKPRKRGGK